ncbi:hypothetical protein GQ600_9026 [Phytophthora cactorum]|nr:hypothetical protein GQ600_9026 [Phytophthora cactorum]
MASVCQTKLWVDRNEAVFRDKKTSLQVCAAQYWVIGTRQLRALAKREHRKADTSIRGATLLACLELFVQDPRGFPNHDTLPTQGLLHKISPELCIMGHDIPGPINYRYIFLARVAQWELSDGRKKLG